MARPTDTIPTVALLCLTILAVAGCGDRGEPLRTYYAPKPTPPDLAMTAGMGGPSAPDMSDASQPTSGSAPGSAPGPPAGGSLHWADPEGWSRTASDNAMRLATLTADDPGAGLPPITVARFPGQVGGVTLNVNRWRRQLGLAPVDDAAAQDAIRDLTGSPIPGRLVEISADARRTVVGWFTVGGQQWFFKLTGDTEKVEQARPALMSLLRSVHLPHGDAPAPGTPTAPGSPTPPMATGPGSAPAAGDTPGGENPHGFAPLQSVGTFEAGGMTGPIPAGWTLQENPGGPVLAKLNHTPEASDAPAQATISVTRFPGDVGGPLANVNRWRRQVGMDPIDDITKQDSMAMPIDGRRATIYQVVPRPPKADSKRIIVASIPDGGQTWFMKMTGPSAELEPEVANFVQLISRLDLPGPPPPEASPPEAQPPDAPGSGSRDNGP